MIDLDGPDPLWRQAADHIAARIAAGEWEHRLPSVRTLASEYGVSHATISDALRDLAARGLVVTTQGRGTFVKRPADPGNEENPGQAKD